MSDPPNLINHNGRSLMSENIWPGTYDRKKDTVYAIGQHKQNFTSIHILSELSRKKNFISVYYLIDLSVKIEYKTA